METKPMSREELARVLELLKSKIQTLKQAQVRLEREAMQLADAIRANQSVREHTQGREIAGADCETR
jgi:hypothetical protein